MPEVFHLRSPMPVSAAELFRWHARPGAFSRLLPPWERVVLVRTDGSLRDGARTVLRVPLVGPLRKTWIAEHHDYVEGEQFCDRQVTGPFAAFDHVHRMEPAADGTSFLDDRIEYRLPLGTLGRLFGGRSIRKALERMFAYRHRLTAEDLRRHAAHADQPRLKVLVAGSTGSVGQALVPFLTTGGHQVTRLIRPKTRITAADHGTATIEWDPAAGQLPLEPLEGFDAVVNLAGAGIADRRWNESYKQEILRSRVDTTKLLSQALARLHRPPRVFISASATGFYGHRGISELTESAVPGCGFLPKVCQAWELAAAPALAAGIRTVLLRIGVVLTPRAGALAEQMPLFRWGLGGRLGEGKQYLSWISMDDLVYSIHHCLWHAELAGPVNAVAPQAVTNGQFTKELGRVLGRPTLLAVPAAAATVLLGEMAPALLLASLKVVPHRLLASGFHFAYPDLAEALRHLLAA